jgi:hypothetical protein
MVTKSKVRTNFESMAQKDVPRGRNGKHKGLVTTILSDLDRLEKGAALKVPLADVKVAKERLRSALNRATRKRGLTVATASDEKFLYIWSEEA